MTTGMSDDVVPVVEVGLEDQNDISSPTTVGNDEENIADPIMIPEKYNYLTVQEIWNLSFCFLAWACNVSTVTLGNYYCCYHYLCFYARNLIFALWPYLFTSVIGTSNNVLLSIGGDTSIASVPFGAFFLGTALVSCCISGPLFRRAGRRMGFLVGISFGLLGSVLGIISLFLELPWLNIISTFVFGTANGIGYHLRFAVIENVPMSWGARAVTFVVSGGVIASFAGPEAGQATGGLFGSNDENLYYIGVFMVAGIFCIANVVFIALVRFSPLPESANNVSSDVAQHGSASYSVFAMYRTLLSARSFLVPMLRATFGWVIMAVPMSILRLAMRDAGFTSRQSLLAIELHFCGMYAPGFISGNLIKHHGVRPVCLLGWIISCISLVILILSKSENDGSIARWYLGMIMLGAGWNFQFTGTTVWLNDACQDLPYSKVQIQSANDFLMFFISGAWIFCASFIYDASFWGEGTLSGWVTVNYCVAAFLAADFVVILLDMYFEAQVRNRKQIVSRENDANEEALSSSVIHD
jgi:MFS family permease